MGGELSKCPTPVLRPASPKVGQYNSKLIYTL